MSDVVEKISEEFEIYGIDPNRPAEGPVFTLFRKLPAELRIKIWKLSLPEPRLISADIRPLLNRRTEYDTPSGLSDNDSSDSKSCKVIIDSKFYGIPQLLVNHESREETLKIYTIRLPTYDPLHELRLCKDDVLHLRGGLVFDDIERAGQVNLEYKPILSKIPTLAFISRFEAQRQLKRILTYSNNNKKSLASLTKIILLPEKNQRYHGTFEKLGETSELCPKKKELVVGAKVKERWEEWYRDRQEFMAIQHYLNEVNGQREKKVEFEVLAYLPLTEEEPKEDLDEEDEWRLMLKLWQKDASWP